MKDLGGKVALVTGSSSGIGAEIALALAREGTHVAVHYNSRRSQAEAIVTRCRDLGVQAEPFAADVSDTSQIRQLAEAVLVRFGGVDILVNNAGGFVRRSLLVEADDELIDQVFHLNGRSMVALCQGAREGRDQGQRRCTRGHRHPNP